MKDHDSTQQQQKQKHQGLDHSQRHVSCRRWLRILIFGFGAGFWTSTLLWTIEHHHQQTHAPLVESNCMQDAPVLSKSKADFLESSKLATGTSLVKETRSSDQVLPVKDPSSDRSPLQAALPPTTTAENATAIDTVASDFKDDTAVVGKKVKTPPSPTWWKHYVPKLAKVWQRRSVDSWCGTLEPNPPTSFLLGHDEVAEGMIYIKTYKASSSTCEGIAWSIAHHVGKRQQRNKTAGPSSSISTAVCKAYTRHEFADNRMHARRHPTKSLLWTFVRNPAARDLSHIYHFEIGRNNRTDMTSEDIQKQIQTRIKGRQTRYLVPTKTSRAPLWPLHELRKNRTELVSYIKSEIFENYDFLGLTERMTESLAVMVLLWDLQPQDVIVLNSKRSGGFDDGGHNDTCTVIPRAVLTPELKEYFETKHPLWNADVLLYHAANASLQMTIEALGTDRVQRVAESIERLQARAQELCLDEAFFPCSANGTFQPQLAEKSCYVQDAGCGHECVDRVLSPV